MRRALARWVVVAALLLAAPSPARPPATVNVGVLLPTTLGDGQARFDFGQKLAAALQKQLGRPVLARSFARYSDLVAEARAGKIDLGILDGWIAAQSSEQLVPLALAVVAGETRQRWAVVADQARSIPELVGKKLALTHGVGPALDAQLVTNVVFEGDLEAGSFKLTFVPAVESATKMLDVGSADAALLPLAQAGKKRVVYKSTALPIAAAVAFRGNPHELGAALQAVGEVAPFDRFVGDGMDELAALRRVLQRGPTPRAPVIAESPPPRVDTRALVTFKGVRPLLPSFVESLHLPTDSPGD